jgi:hypothetical protein
MNRDWKYWQKHKELLATLTSEEIEQITARPLSEEAMRFDELVRNKLAETQAQSVQIRS